MAGSETSPLANIAIAREVIATYSLQAKKSFGQNFLINDAIVRKTIELANVKAGDYVTEIGPGYGTLTVALVRAGANVLAVEKDAKMINALYDNLEKYCEEGKDKIEVLRQDALRLDFGAYERRLEGKNVKMVSNLPYNVAAPIVITYFQKLPNMSQATVMVQKEIADRMVAKPGNKNYGAYTVKLAMFADYAGKFPVSRSNFMPQPRVDSTVINLVRHDRIKPKIANTACVIADAAFAHRRKTIANSVKEYFCDDTIMLEKIAKAFEKSNMDMSLRAEALSPQDYAIIAGNL
ncbi:MAG: 16S rRNA (adenine(1518)-N(6)/adenine(1519)-N(6))-dimethyltransferase RsmA [Coriobacteriia bacterium]|nr:16S rRNA (adenine(1518)-N(6)/adenine(1519)-N(6))-dimethyltransferase RsmA [Coriobacteriia bacterium]